MAVAALYLEQAVALQPHLAIAHRNLARVAEERGDRAGAERSYRRSLELDPEDIRTRLPLARLLLSEERYDEAIRHYQRVLRAAPATPAAVRGLAEARAEQGDVAEAVALYRRLVELRPDDAKAGERLRALEADPRAAPGRPLDD